MKKSLEVFHRGIEAGLHPGGQFTVRLHGKTLCDEAFGNARPGVLMTPDSVQLWMSAGKPLAAIAILQQVVAGTITLDTRVAEVIPEFGLLGKAAITVRHILTHTAGFRGPLNNFAPGPWEAILRRIWALRQEPGWTPGEKAGYHVGSSWFLLGELIRRLDGRSFDVYVRERVLEPVGARDSSVGMTMAEAEALGDHLAIVTPDFPGNQPDGIIVPRPGANARGPVRDLAAVYQSLLDHDGRLLPPELSRQMIARQREGMFDETFKQTIDWGWGLKLDSKRYGAVNGGGETYGYGPHASDATFGHSGNQCGCAFADPAHGLVVAWVVNGMPGEPKHQQRQNEINAAIYEDLGLA
ncbi:MAG: putative esterase [Phycisphaerales bacterium]|nr:putative esterase [Phycisphaerales bacterium]